MFFPFETCAKMILLEGMDKTKGTGATRPRICDFGMLSPFEENLSVFII